MVHRRSIRVLPAVALVAVVSLTCGEGSGPDSNAVARVVITPATGSLDTGDSLQLTASVRNAAGDELAGKTIVWSTLTPSLVAVGAHGMVRGRWPGAARVVATTEGLADTVSLQVVPKISRIVVTVPFDTLTSLFAVMSVTVHAFIDTQSYSGGSYTWSLSNTSVAQLFATGPDSVQTLQARANGETYVRVVEARGAVDSARIVVRQRVARILAPSSPTALRSCAIRLFAAAVDSLNTIVPGAVLTWVSADTTRARVDSTGLVTPLAAGVDTIIVSSDGVSQHIALIVDVAPTPTFRATGTFAPATTVGVDQYALGYGDVPTNFIGAPARFRLVSSDTTILRPTPADTNGYITSNTISFGPLRLVGRAVGNVMLTPYVCDAAGAAAPFRVTRGKLAWFGPPPSTARTDDLPVNLTIRFYDSTGVSLFNAVPLTVHFTATDTNVIRADSTDRHLPIGTDQFYMNWTFTDSGTARIVLLDSSGSYLPDSSSAVHVVYPPLYIFSDGAGQADTLHIGLRQKPYYDVYRARVGKDRFVSGAPLPIHVSISDSTIVRVGPDSLEIPVGQSATVGQFDIASRDTRGTAVVTVRAHRHMNDQVAIVVGRPAVQVQAPAGFVNYPGDPDRAVQLFAVDSATGSVGFPTENVTFSLTVSDTSVLTLDSTTLTVPAGDYASGLAGITLKKPGSATITATDPRVAAYSYVSATSAPVIIDQPSLSADSALSLGVAQTYSFGVVINGPPLPPGQAVHVSHTNPAVATLSDTIAPLYVPGYAVVGASGVSPGVDTVIASAPGFRPDTGLIVVGMGTFEVALWPLGLNVNETRTLELKVFGPNGDARLTAVTTTFTLAANGNIEFFQDGVPVTSITFDPGQHFMQFTVKGKAAGTGTVTVSAPNYASVTKTVTVAP